MIKINYINNIKHLGLVLLVCALLQNLSSCSKEVNTYRGESGVYFAMSIPQNYVNSDTLYTEVSNLPFIITESKDSTFHLKLKILGPVSNQERKVSVRVVEDETTAVEGDFEPIQEEYSFPVGQVFASIPIHFHRQTSLKRKERKLTLELVENNDFTLPLKMWKNSSDEYVSIVKHTIIYSDKYVKLKGYYTSYFGPFSEKKMKLILELFNMKLVEFDQKLPYAYAKTLGQGLDRHLKEMKAKGETIYEEDGSEMVAGDYIYK